MLLKSKIRSIIKKLDGNLIGIGIKDKSILEEINRNDKIVLCDLLNSISNESFEVDKNRKKKKYVKNLVKRYKKIDIDYMIIDSSEIEKLLKTFIVDSIKISDKKIYIYSDKKYIAKRIEKRYRRYTKNTDITKYEDGYILEIKTDNVKIGFIKRKLYYIIDTFSNISDLIADLLIS